MRNIGKKSGLKRPNNNFKINASINISIQKLSFTFKVKIRELWIHF